MWVCGPSGLVPPGPGIGVNTSIRPIRVRNTRCGPAATRAAATGLPGEKSGRPAPCRRAARVPGSAVRTQASTARRPRPRSNRMDPRSSGRAASASGPSSVTVARPAMAQASSGRQRAMAWFQPEAKAVS